MATGTGSILKQPLVSEAKKRRRANIEEADNGYTVRLTTDYETFTEVNLVFNSLKKAVSAIVTFFKAES
jgi:hypothetical protein